MRKTSLKLWFLLVLFAVPTMGQMEKALESFKLGEAALAVRNYDGAIKHYTDCINAFPEVAANCHLNRAAALLFKSKTKPEPVVDFLPGRPVKPVITEVTDDLRVRALADVNKVLQMTPRSPEAYYLRAEIYAAESIYEPALADYRAGIALDPQPEQWKTQLAMMEKRYAQQMGRRALDLFMNGLSAASKDKAKSASLYREALEFYTKALLLDKNNADNLRGRGNVHRFLDNYPAAIADYTEAIRVKPDYLMAFNGRAEVYALQNKPDLAIADYERVMAVPVTLVNKGDFFAAVLGRGKVRLDTGRLDDAIADFTKYLSEENYFQQTVFLYRGQAYAKKKNTALAVADFRSALAITPNYQEAKDELTKLGINPEETVSTAPPIAAKSLSLTNYETALSNARRQSDPSKYRAEALIQYHTSIKSEGKTDDQVLQLTMQRIKELAEIDFYAVFQVFLNRNLTQDFIGKMLPLLPPDQKAAIRQMSKLFVDNFHLQRSGKAVTTLPEHLYKPGYGWGKTVSSN